MDYSPPKNAYIQGRRIKLEFLLQISEKPFFYLLSFIYSFVCCPLITQP